MIFTSLGILIAALGFLIAGIIRSSIPLLVVSLVGTAAAAFILLATADLARRRQWEAQGLAPAGGAPAAPPGTQPVLVYMPVGDVPQVAPTAAVPARKATKARKASKATKRS